MADEKGKNIFLAVAAGILYALAFPKFNIYFCAFLWPLPLYSLLRKVPNPKAAFILSWLSGASAFLLILYWIPITILTAGGNLAAAVAAWFAISIYLALFFGLFGLLFFLLIRRVSEIWLATALAASWVALEFLKAKVLTGFPWCLLGYALAGHKAFAQMAEWGGVWILSFFIMLCSTFFWFSWRACFDLKQWIRAGLWSAASTTLLILAFTWGRYRYKELDGRLRSSLKVAILQGNINQYEKWDENKTQMIVNVYQGLAHEAVLAKPDIIVWPESSWPYIQSMDPKRDFGEAGDITQTLKKIGGTHLVGSVFVRSQNLYNSAALISRGEMLGRYDKVHLVPFGEFVPLRSLLARWAPVVNAVGEFMPGQSHKPLTLPNGRKAGVTICYESIFPEIAANLKRNGSEILINLTNDGWYLDTAAPYQHFLMNILRAIETRLPLLRAANTGISAVISPVGAVKVMAPLGERKVIFAEVPEVDMADPGSLPIIFQDLFPIVCLGVFLWLVVRDCLPFFR